MEINRIIFYLGIMFLLNGCFQSTAMVGPAITVASTGNISQAGLTFITNRAVEQETGMDTVSLVSKKIGENNSKNRIRRDLKKLVETNFHRTRQKLILQDQSNLFN